jgi:pimeloyl-ACP methyl ester carboxylesterase
MNTTAPSTGQKQSSEPTGRGDAPTIDTLVARSRRILHWLAHVALALLKWALVTILALLAALLVGVSLRWGPTHWAVALLLAAVWVGLVVLLVLATTRFHSRRIFFAAMPGFLLLSLTTVAVSQASAYTPSIVDAHGTPIPGSIATLEKVTLNGSDQWISIRGTSIDKPVLLFLAGGPGGSQLATARRTLGRLEDHFVVVNWEQPGAGKSFDAVARSTLTPERYIEDGHALVVYLKQRFNQPKVYVVGESWGSALGIMLVQRYPELFHAFVGTGQMVAFTATDRMDYEFALRWAQERSDTVKLEKLKAQGPPLYYGDDVAWKQATYLLDTFRFAKEMRKCKCISDVALLFSVWSCS